MTAHFALDPPWLGRTLAVVARKGGTSMLTERALPNRAVSEGLNLLHWLYDGRDWFGLTVDVVGPDHASAFTMVDRNQARVTGISAATIGRALHEDRVEGSGVWLAEEVIEPMWFFERLAEQDVTYVLRDDVRQKS